MFVKMHYDENFALFTSPDGTTYTEEQLDHLLDLERQWRRSLPRYRFQELLHIFPEATRIAKRELKRQMKEARARSDYDELKKLSSKLAYVESLLHPSPSGDPTTITLEMISRAKQVPISSLIEVNRANKALCLFHQDRTPSLHVYPDNHYYCFVCNASGGSITLYRALNPNATFREAVHALLSHLKI